MNEIAASAQEQATELDWVNAAMNQMDQITQQNAAMVEESTAASRSLAAEAEGMANSVARLRVGEPRNLCEPDRHESYHSGVRVVVVPLTEA